MGSLAGVKQTMKMSSSVSSKHLALRQNRSSNKNTNSIKCATKRKSNGNIARVKLHPSRRKKLKNLRSQNQSSRNRNNCKGKSSIQKRAKNSKNHKQSIETQSSATVYMFTGSPYPMYAPNFGGCGAPMMAGVSQVPMTTQVLDAPQMRVGNPSITPAFLPRTVQDQPLLIKPQSCPHTPHYHHGSLPSEDSSTPPSHVHHQARSLG
ncbi:hypothetical protein PoB_003824500 [Plakobranchus ocellatus]|uniref:Uncharacterized protein n=1 Tax=Plakobranchus ocellatus TaxID=259542 RepID=A0AAV4ATS3_9GAST|nr:hypothetical protein PoB_003824500 [Plakobranchus ocellatus]